MIVLGKLFGLSGLLYAGPTADGIAFLLASIFLIKEIRNLKSAEQSKASEVSESSENSENSESSESSENSEMDVSNINENNTNNLQGDVIITISREYGSGGRYIGKLVAEQLGIKLYDKEVIAEIAEETGFSKEYIENTEQKKSIADYVNDGYYYELNNSDELFIKESELIKERANEGSSVIVGRCANFILKDYANTLNIFIYSDMENKVKRATTETDWKSPLNYDICINSDALGVEESAKLICDLVKGKINKS